MRLRLEVGRVAVDERLQDLDELERALDLAPELLVAEVLERGLVVALGERNERLADVLLEVLRAEEHVERRRVHELHLPARPSPWRRTVNSSFESTWYASPSFWKRSFASGSSGFLSGCSSRTFQVGALISPPAIRQSVNQAIRQSDHQTIRPSGNQVGALLGTRRVRRHAERVENAVSDTPSSISFRILARFFFSSTCFCTSLSAVSHSSASAVSE